MNVLKRTKILGLFLICVVLVSEMAVARQMGQEGNGGGGLYRNGRYMTFYSAGFFTESVSIGLTEVPALDETIDAIYKIPGLKKANVAKYLKAILPSNERQYYNVLPEEFSDEVHDRLIAEYGRVTGAPKTGLALFAVTDSNSKTTYLLPSFYELNTFEQMAIIFHESYWLVNPHARYQEVINAEVTMQAYFENPRSKTKLLKALEIVGDAVDVLAYSIKRDIKKRYLKRLLSGSKKIKLKKLFGEDYFSCLKAKHRKHCQDIWQYRVYELQRAYSKSLFVKNLDKLEIISRYRLKNEFLDNAYILLDMKEHQTCLQIIGTYTYNGRDTAFRGSLNIQYDTVKTAKPTVNFCLKQ